MAEREHKWRFLITLTVEIVLVVVTILAYCSQQKQIAEAQKRDIVRDSIERMKDSIAYIKDSSIIDLAARQSKAIERQALVSERGIKNIEIAQRPILEASKVGFLKVRDNNQYFLYFQIINIGVRPCLLDTVYFYSFDKFFEPIDTIIKTQSLYLSGDRTFYFHDNNPLGSSDLLALDNLYIIIHCSYKDPLSKRTVSTRHKPFIYKWTKKTGSEIYITQEGNTTYAPFHFCSTDEQTKLLKRFYKK